MPECVICIFVEQLSFVFVGKVREDKAPAGKWPALLFLQFGQPAFDPFYPFYPVIITRSLELCHRSKPKPTFQTWFVAAFLLTEEMTTKGRREERGSTSRGKGRTTPLRGGRFWTLIVLRGQSFTFGRKWKWCFHKKWILMLVFWWCNFIVSWKSDTMWPGRKPKHVMDVWDVE